MKTGTWQIILFSTKRIMARMVDKETYSQLISQEIFRQEHLQMQQFDKILESFSF